MNDRKRRAPRRRRVMETPEEKWQRELDRLFEVPSLAPDLSAPGEDPNRPDDDGDDR